MHPMYEANQAPDNQSHSAASGTRSMVIGLSLAAALGLVACSDKNAEAQKHKQPLRHSHPK